MRRIYDPFPTQEQPHKDWLYAVNVDSVAYFVTKID